MLGKCASAELTVGDQFSRTEDVETIWTVQRVIQLPKLPKHAVMTCDKPVPRQILVSEFVLRDRRLYRAVHSNAAPVEQAASHRRWLFGR